MNADHIISSLKLRATPLDKEAANLIESQQAKLKSIRNGKWIDKFGACVCCDGEIPHGHFEDCDLYKAQQKLESQKKEIIEWKRKFSAAHELFRAQEKEIDRRENLLAACEAIADGDEGWEKLVNECLVTQSVANLRSEIEKDHEVLNQETKPKDVK